MWHSKRKKQDDADMSGENQIMLRAIDARMHRALRPAKLTLAVVSVLVVIAIGTVGWLVNQSVTHPLANKIVSNSITTCQGSNVYRADQTKIWQYYLALQAKENADTAAELSQLISVLARGDATEILRIRAILAVSGAKDFSDQNAFIERVAMTNTPRNCVAANSTSGG